MTVPTRGYLTVTEEQLMILQRERVHALELDHARTVLLCQETINTEEEATSFRQLAELERRIAVHVQPIERNGAVVEPVDDAVAVEVDAADNPDEVSASNETVTAKGDAEG